MGKSGYNTDRIAAIFVLIFSAVFLRELKYVHNPLDVVFPKTILYGMVFLSAILLVKSFVKPDPKAKKDLRDIKNRGRIIGGTIGIIIWLLVIPVLGFAFTSLIAVVVISLVLGDQVDRTPRKMVASIAIGFLIVGFIYYFFRDFMEVQLPRGILF